MLGLKKRDLRFLSEVTSTFLGCGEIGWQGLFCCHKPNFILDRLGKSFLAIDTGFPNFENSVDENPRKKTFSSHRNRERVLLRLTAGRCFSHPLSLSTA